MRFYYNPITSVLEPIGFDGHFGAFTSTSNYKISSEVDMYAGNVWGRWNRKFFGNINAFDLEFFRAYIRTVERFSDRSYLDNLFSNLHEELEKNLAIIYKDFPLTIDPEVAHMSGAKAGYSFHFSRESLYFRQEKIRELFENPKKRVHAYFLKSQSGKIVLEVGNIEDFLVPCAGPRKADNKR